MGIWIQISALFERGAKDVRSHTYQYYYGSISLFVGISIMRSSSCLLELTLRELLVIRLNSH